VLRRFPTSPGVLPSGLAYDSEHHRLFVGCRNKQLVVLDSDTGRVIGALPIGGGVDGTVFDSELGLAFAPSSDGTLAVVKEETPEKFTLLEAVTTEPEARTVALDPKSHRLYLPTASFTPQSPGRPKQVEGSFRILVIGR
jgi:DNA-binding beta-propeller fold protein YncE